jgi:hypothetical protein
MGVVVDVVLARVTFASYLTGASGTALATATKKDSRTAYS